MESTTKPPMKIINNSFTTASKITAPAGVVVIFKNGAKSFHRGFSLASARYFAAGRNDVEAVREFEYRGNRVAIGA